MRNRLLVPALFLIVSRGVAGQVPDTNAISRTTGTLGGIVRDTLGTVLRDAEVGVPDVGRWTRTDSEGRFVLGDVPPGNREVWVRKVGYIVVQFQWPAAANTRLNVAVTMRPLPHTLDPVVVWASEEKTMKSRSIVRGFVVDSAGDPVEGAEVSLLGSGRATTTLANGSFTFRHVSDGPRTLQARLMGYSPSIARFDLLADDERVVYLKMNQLPHTLDEVRVTAESGYGPLSFVEKDFDARIRWRPQQGSTVFMGPVQMQNLRGIPLDMAMRGVFKGFTRDAPGQRSTAIPGECILEDGLRRSNRNGLRSYSAEEVEMLEYYPPNTEWTGTIALRFSGTACDGAPGHHPAYYVLWLKGKK